MSRTRARGLQVIASFAIVLALLAATSHGSGADVDPTYADRVLVEKAARKLTLFSAGRSLRTYQIALGKNPVGPKQQEGDARTPEGSYVIDRRLVKSRFHRALHISYPNPDDLARARTLGVSAGGDIMIHGIKNGMGWVDSMHRVSDWTQGCIAVTNAEIEEIWSLVKDGTPVDIVP